MRLLIAAVGRLRAGPERELFERYIERATAAGRAVSLSPLEIAEIAESQARRPADRMVEEAARLEQAIPKGAKRIMLDSGGRNLTSEDFAGTGEGQYLDLSMVDALYHMHEYNVHGPSVAGDAFVPRRMGAHHEMIAPFGVFRGPTGNMVIAGLQLQWRGLCEARGRPEIVEEYPVEYGTRSTKTT
jgi:hypothetical protein